MSEILVARGEGFAVVRINRPSKRNTLTEEGIRELSRTFDDLEVDGSIRCVLLRGEGEDAFSAGYDLTALSQSGPAAEADELHVLFDRIESYPFPVVALLRGYAIGGGCELALACDIRIAGDDVRMGMPPARLGLVYPLAGYARFHRTLGLGPTKEIFFSGRTYGAADCRRLGLVSEIVPAAEAERKALELVQEIAGNAPLSLSGTKRILRHLTLGREESTEDERELADLFRRSLGTRDLLEGKSSRAEGRRPVFSGC
ncbi:MAG: enoyl-CoA hydratase/isomerase family protein [Deltaproteobacteria bacterium]|nr:enoyl-CoA hydratase/isomerase family protein [Deltaproteobacteria bacterium]